MTCESKAPGGGGSGSAGTKEDRHRKHNNNANHNHDSDANGCSSKSHVNSTSSAFAHSHDKMANKPSSASSSDAVDLSSLNQPHNLATSLSWRFVSKALVVIVFAISLYLSPLWLTKGTGNNVSVAVANGHSNLDLDLAGREGVGGAYDSAIDASTPAPAPEILPSVSVGILVRNKAHSLPYFLGGLEALDYPKSRMHLFIRVDNCIDDSSAVMATWLRAVSGQYHSVDVVMENSTNPSERGPADELAGGFWTAKHYGHIIRLRQAALDSARLTWADFHFSVDADVILVNPNTLRHLVNTSLRPPADVVTDSGPVTIIAPLINCTNSNVYANFWGGMTEDGYYSRSSDYFELQRRYTSGVFPVAMVHSVLLVNLRHLASVNLSYSDPPPGYETPQDDLILFARSAQHAGVAMYLDNREFFGYAAMPVDDAEVEAMAQGEGAATGPDGGEVARWLRREVELFVHLRLQAVLDDEAARPLPLAASLRDVAARQTPPASLHGFDAVYMINLERRPDRRVRMEYALRALGVAAQHVPAVDGRQLTRVKLDAMGIRQLPGYSDPYHKRSLKYGEIGCFLSHYALWQVWGEAPFVKDSKILSSGPGQEELTEPKEVTSSSVKTVRLLRNRIVSSNTSVGFQETM